MSETGLVVEMALPFGWQRVDAAARTAPELTHGNLVLLRVVHLMEASGLPREGEPERHHDRLEAKLDLALHWLALSLFGEQSRPDAVTLQLDPNGVEWAANESFRNGEVLRVTLYPHSGLPAPLQLDARVSHAAQGRVRAEVSWGSAALEEAWSQWLFRQHRRSVQASREVRG